MPGRVRRGFSYLAGTMRGCFIVIANLFLFLYNNYGLLQSFTFSYVEQQENSWKIYMTIHYPPSFFRTTAI